MPPSKPPHDSFLDLRPVSRAPPDCRLRPHPLPRAGRLRLRRLGAQRIGEQDPHHRRTGPRDRAARRRVVPQRGDVRAPHDRDRGERRPVACRLLRGRRRGDDQVVQRTAGKGRQADRHARGKGRVRRDPGGAQELRGHVRRRLRGQEGRRRRGLAQAARLDLPAGLHQVPGRPAAPRRAPGPGDRPGRRQHPGREPDGAPRAGRLRRRVADPRRPAVSLAGARHHAPDPARRRRGQSHRRPRLDRHHRVARSRRDRPPAEGVGFDAGLAQDAGVAGAHLHRQHRHRLGRDRRRQHGSVVAHGGGGVQPAADGGVDRADERHRAELGAERALRQRPRGERSRSGDARRRPRRSRA